MLKRVRSSIYTKTAQSGLRELLRSDEIEERVTALADEISRDYGDDPPLVVAVLKGAFVFMSDLIRRMNIPLEVDFVRLASYGDGTVSSGQARLVSDLATPVAGRDVLIVEDIVDTGNSLEYLIRVMRDRGARSVRICALLDKPSRRVTDIKPDYIGFTIPNVFVVGYGIDYSEKFRQLPDIYALEDEGEDEE